MSKVFSILGIFILAMSVTLACWAANPCRPIAKACMAQGYYKGGNKVGKGLIENCVMPVATKEKTLPNATFSDAVLQQCKMLLMEKMQKH